MVAMPGMRAFEIESATFTAEHSGHSISNFPHSSQPGFQRPLHPPSPVGCVLACKVNSPFCIFNACAEGAHLSGCGNGGRPTRPRIRCPATEMPSWGNTCRITFEIG